VAAVKAGAKVLIGAATRIADAGFRSSFERPEERRFSSGWTSLPRKASQPSSIRRWTGLAVWMGASTTPVSKVAWRLLHQQTDDDFDTIISTICGRLPGDAQ